MLVLLLLAVIPLIGAEFPYSARREAVRTQLEDGVTVLWGVVEQGSGKQRSGVFQETNFFYLTGWREPGAILLLDPSREILFLPRRSAESAKWTGPKSAPDDDDIAARSGFSQVQPVEHFEKELRVSLERFPKVYALAGTPATGRLKQLAPLRDVLNAQPAIARLRMRKTVEEVARIQHATDVTIEAHRAAWGRVSAGLHEYQIGATMAAIALERGCERMAYAPIIASGPNAVTLHYWPNRRRMDSGDLLLMDVAAECSGYASDVTRTIPVNGRFSARQRELYDIVLAAQKAVVAAVKPGMRLSRGTVNSLYEIALQHFNRHELGQYFTHGIGHHVGLDVHDPADPLQPLEAGMVVTVEPGLYLPDEGIGIRIEDVVLVTETGVRVLSSALPKEPVEIEKALRR
ncbi:MAG: aminopeptidase P family protein [Bryobacterales bacterium]|nr:aminopeptidase P family protein [Bryobacterales bacterium]